MKERSSSVLVIRDVVLRGEGCVCYQRNQASGVSTKIVWGIAEGSVIIQGNISKE